MRYNPLSNIDPSLLTPRNPGEDFMSHEQWAEIGEALGLSNRQLKILVLTFEGATQKALRETQGQRSSNIGFAHPPRAERIAFQRKVIMRSSAIMTQSFNGQPKASAQLSIAVASGLPLNNPTSSEHDVNASCCISRYGY